MKEVSEEYTEIRVTVYVDTSILLKENYCCKDAKTTNIRDNIAIKDDFIQHSAVNNNQILQQLKQKTKLPLDNKVFSSADKAVNLSKHATRGGCDVTQESTKDRCDVTQGSTKSECDVTQESTKRRCDVTQGATKSGCDLIQGYTENRCDVTEGSTKSGCDVRQGSTISGGNVAHRHYVENDRNIFTLLTKHKDHTTMRRYINTGKVKTEPETYRDSYKRTDLKSAVATGKTASPTQQVTLKQPVTNNHFKEKIREVTSDYEGSTSGLSSEDEDCKEEAPDSIKYDQVIYSSVKCGPHVNHPQTISKDTYASNNKTKTDLTKEKKSYTSGT